MNLGKQKAFLTSFAYVAVILLLIFIGLKYMLPILMPFVIGLVVAAILRKMIDFITSKLKINRTVVSIVLLLTFYSILVIVLIFAGAQIFTFIKESVLKVPKLYQTTIEPALNGITIDVLNRFPEVEMYLEDIFNAMNDTIFSFLSNMSTTLFGMVTNFASQIPAILIKLIFTIVATFFFTIDYHRIVGFVLRQLSEDKKKMLVSIIDNVISTLGKFIRAYATLITITFIELSLGFLILKVPNPFLIAGLVAFIDILPILGTGAVLLPWSVIAFILGNTPIGIGMLVLYVIITIVRQALEPRVVGQQIGLHPIVTLLCIFIGAQTFGVVGLLLLPVTATLLKKLNDEGTIHLFK